MQERAVDMLAGHKPDHKKADHKLVIGLTGGIGAGKSTVADLLAALGAEVVDVDAIGRTVLEPGGGAYAGVVQAFGSRVLSDDGEIDRAALAAEVFGEAGSGSESRLVELEAISHPAINAHLGERLATAGTIVVLDMAVLAESDLGKTQAGPVYQRVIVVEAPLEVRLVRLVDRGLTEADARARIANQANDEDRRMLADVIVTNASSLEALSTQLDTLWPTIEAWQLQVSAP